GQPRCLDGGGARAALDLGQIEQFTKTAALGTPALRGIVAEQLGVERLEGAAALRAGTLSRVDAEGLGIVQREQSAAPKLEGFVDELLGGRRRMRPSAVM